MFELNELLKKFPYLGQEGGRRYRFLVVFYLPLFNNLLKTIFDENTSEIICSTIILIIFCLKGKIFFDFSN